MKNPMSLQKQHQALDDNDALIPMQWRCFNNHETLWRDRSLGAAGKPLNFYSNEYRRKPEPLVRYTHVVNDALSITSENLQDALDSQAVHRGGVIYRMVEDPDWVEPEPAMPPTNQWRKIVNGEWPECKATDNILVKDTQPGGCNGTGECNYSIIAGAVAWGNTTIYEWRYAEGDK